MSEYDRSYDDQPTGEWMRCPWHDDPEERAHKSGSYARKCPCPNCVYHRYSGRGVSGSLKRWLISRGFLRRLCYTCARHGCSKTDAHCGAWGRVTEIRRADSGGIELKMDNTDQ